MPVAPDKVRMSAGQPEQEWYRRGYNAFVSYFETKAFLFLINYGG